MHRIAREASAFLVMGAITASCALWTTADAQEKKPQPARILSVLPIGVKAGDTTKITVRGHGLEGAKEVRFESGASGKITSSGKAPVYDKNPERVGDTQAVVEIKVDADAKPTLRLTIVASEGDLQSPEVLIDRDPLPEKNAEPNEGFRTSQSLKRIPTVVDGVIEKARDVDVYALNGKKGQTLRIEIRALRHGSAIDPFVTAFRKDAIPVELKKEVVDRDAILTADLPADDVYHIVVQDAHDTGSPLHVYRLQIEVK